MFNSVLTFVSLNENEIPRFNFAQTFKSLIFHTSSTSPVISSLERICLKGGLNSQSTSLLIHWRFDELTTSDFLFGKTKNKRASKTQFNYGHSLTFSLKKLPSSLAGYPQLFFNSTLGNCNKLRCLSPVKTQMRIYWIYLFLHYSFSSSFLSLSDS